MPKIDWTKYIDKSENDNIKKHSKGGNRIHNISDSKGVDFNRKKKTS